MPLRKYLKWTGIILGGLLALLVLTGFILYSVGKKKLKRSYADIVVEAIPVPTDSAAIAHGRHLAVTWACTRCHADNLGGILFKHDPVEGKISLMGGVIPASNLTSGKGGIGNAYTETDWVRAIRHGVKQNGRSAVFMYDYSAMSDKDLGDLIAYLKQTAPVDAEYPALRYGPILPMVVGAGIFKPAAVSVDHNIKHVDHIVQAPTREYGEYLFSGCRGCHGAGVTKPLQATWTRNEFVHIVKTGIGKAMPSATYGELNDTELEALWLYLSNPASTKTK